MAAARHIPRTELTSKITFTNNVPSPQAVIVGSGAQVEFALAPGSTETIQLVFSPNPLVQKPPVPPPPFVNVTLVPGAPPDTQDPPNCSVNYNVKDANGNQLGGPYAIQVGASNPLIIQLTYSGGSGDCQPASVMVPLNGKLQLQTTDDNSYNVMGLGNPPFNPPISTVGAMSGSIITAAIGPASPTPYTYTVIGPADQGNGGGNVIIRSS